MKSCSALRGWVSAASLLLPWWAAAESQLPAGPVSGKVSTSARVDFRIVIPPVLSMDIAKGVDPDGAQKVAIVSNSRGVTLTASSDAAPVARNSVVLRAAARRIIVREGACQVSAVPSRAVASESNRIVCTVSAP